MTRPSPEHFRRQARLLHGDEREVFRGMLRGRNRFQIALELNLSLLAVKTCRDSILKFVGVESAQQMLELARELTPDG